MVHRDLLAVQFRLEEFAMHAHPLRGLARNPEQIRIVIPEYDLDPPRKPRQQIHHERRAQIAAADQHLGGSAHMLDGRRQIPKVVVDVRNHRNAHMAYSTLAVSPWPPPAAPGPGAPPREACAPVPSAAAPPSNKMRPGCRSSEAASKAMCSSLLPANSGPRNGS